MLFFGWWAVAEWWRMAALTCWVCVPPGLALAGEVDQWDRVERLNRG